jgi:hypothetical protein
VALAEDASSPAVIASISGGNPLITTTASFTPPAGSLLVAMAISGRSSGALQTAITITSSPAQTWTVAANAQGAGADNGGTAQIAYTYLAAAPGATTVTASMTNVSSGRSFLVKVITGAAVSQSGAGVNTRVQATISTDGTISVTTTAPGSLVYGASDAIDGNSALTLNGATTLLNDFSNTTQASRYTHWKSAAVTVTPGATTLGGTYAAARKSSIAALEILQVIPPPIGDLVFKQQAVNRSYFY